MISVASQVAFLRRQERPAPHAEMPMGHIHGDTRTRHTRLHYRRSSHAFVLPQSRQ